jgi:hypothetical protein
VTIAASWAAREAGTNDKPRDVVLGHEVPHIRRQKQRLIDIPGAKVLAHSPSLNQTRWDLNSDYSDRLLEEEITNTRSASARYAALGVGQCRGALVSTMSL